MKIAIMYATKTGTTRKAAEALAEAFRAKGAETLLQDLSTNDAMPDADAVIIGGSVRMGQWNKQSLQFVKTNERELFHKHYALYACRCGTDNTRALLEPQIGESLSNEAIAVANLGGEINLSQLKGMDRLIMKMVGKSLEASMKPTGVQTSVVNDYADQVWSAITNA